MTCPVLYVHTCTHTQTNNRSMRLVLADHDRLACIHVDVIASSRTPRRTVMRLWAIETDSCQNVFLRSTKLPTPPSSSSHSACRALSETTTRSRSNKHLCCSDTSFISVPMPCWVHLYSIIVLQCFVFEYLSSEREKRWGWVLQHCVTKYVCTLWNKAGC